MQREEETSLIYLLTCLLYSFFLAVMQNPAFSGDPYFYVQQYVIQHNSEASRTFDKRLKESKDLFEKWKALTDNKSGTMPVDQARKYTRGLFFPCAFMDRFVVPSRRYGETNFRVDTLYGHHRKES